MEEAKIVIWEGKGKGLFSVYQTSQIGGFDTPLLAFQLMCMLVFIGAKVCVCFAFVLLGIG